MFEKKNIDTHCKFSSPGMMKYIKQVVLFCILVWFKYIFIASYFCLHIVKERRCSI